VVVWRLTEYRTDAEREAVVVSSNFEPDLKEPWPVYVRAKKIHEAYKEMEALEPRAPGLKRQAEMKRELAQQFALWPDTDKVSRYLKMVEWAHRFEDYHIHERRRDIFEVQHRAETCFEYFDELSKGKNPGGVAYALENDETFEHAVFDLLFRNTFKNWREIRELKHVHDNPEAREALIKAPKETDPDISREKLEDALTTGRAARPEKRTMGANTKIETFVKWLEELPLKAFRDDIKPCNLLRLRDALALAEKQVESVIGREEKE